MIRLRRSPQVVTALLVGASLTGGVAAQEVGDTAATPAPPGTGGWGAVDIARRPGTTVVAVTIAFPHGSAEDPEAAPGTAWLLGRVVRHLVLDGLDPSARASTEVAVQVSRSQTLFQLVTLPRHWTEAWKMLEWAVLGSTPPPETTERARERMRAVFDFERNAPHREFEVELYQFLSGRDSPWRRPPRGQAGTLASISAGDLATHRDRVYRKAEGVVAVVGPADARPVAHLVTGGEPAPEGGVVAPAFVPLEARPSSPPPWRTGTRVERDREVTSTWIAVAYPVDPATPQTALDMLVHHLDREFNPSPPDPGAFSVEVRLELLGARDVLMVEAAVVPEATRQWERRILAAVEDASTELTEPLYFATYRRRFRAARLLQDAPPESQSARSAVDLLHRARVRDLAEEIALLEPRDLREAAARLADPRILVFGPDLGDGPAR